MGLRFLGFMVVGEKGGGVRVWDSKPRISEERVGRCDRSRVAGLQGVSGFFKIYQRVSG